MTNLMRTRRVQRAARVTKVHDLPANVTQQLTERAARSWHQRLWELPRSTTDEMCCGRQLPTVKPFLLHSLLLLLQPINGARNL